MRHNLRNGIEKVMILKKIVLGVLIMTLIYTLPALAQDEEISDEDVEVIEVLDILENLDVLEEDLDLLEFLTEVGDENEE